jgi:probable F420-dependent oxidoreductase
MKFDVSIFPNNLNDSAAIARQVEDYGFDGLWTAEAAHNPFLPLTHAAAVTQRIELGTAIAVAFPRSPMVIAQIAWDLAAQSKGRFILGLGTQVKAHITKRFSADWSAPVPRLREYIESLRAIWHAFQTGESLRYKGEHYRFSLMTPFFNPGPSDYDNIPIYIAGVNEGLCRLAGELCEGFHVHPFNTVEYLKKLVIPAINEGCEKTGRTIDDVKLTASVFVVTGRNQEEMQRTAIETKSQIAFYASTPSYRVILDINGWGDLGDKLSEMARQGKWMEMWREISDDMLAEVAVIAPPDELPYKVRERYNGLLDRIAYYLPFRPEEADKRLIWEYASRAMIHA